MQTDTNKSESFWKSLSKAEKVMWILTIIGLIADMLAIIQVISVPTPKEPFNIVLTPGFAFGLWCLATFTYVSGLHSYWQKKNHTHLFGQWLLFELVCEFKYPKLLYPIFILVILIFSIAWVSGIGFVVVLMLIGFFTILLLLVVISSYNSYHENISERLDWEWWEERISSELETYPYVTEKNFRDAEIMHNTTSREFRYIFAKYASENVESMKYVASIRDIKTEKSVSNALVNMTDLDMDKFEIQL